jgi:protein BCP1
MGGKKRSRDTDGQGDVAMADPAVDKRDDDSSDDEVRRKKQESRPQELTSHWVA